MLKENKDHTIIDSFNRVHNYLRISLTEKCNLRCFYCMPEEGIPLRENSNFMTPDEILGIAKVFVNLGVNKIRLTGGEPLVKKDVGFIIEELSKLPIEIAITTNGILIDKFIPLLKKSNVNNINLSLDSLIEEKFNRISRRNYFNQVMNNIDLLLKNNFNVKINIVLMRGENDDEIIDFIQWTIRENIHIRFIEFMPFDGNNWNWEKKVSFQEIIQIVENKFGLDGFKKIQNQANDTSRNFQLNNAKGTFGIISSVTNPFCDTCNRIRLTADGKIKNCLFSQNELDILNEYRNGGNIEPIIQNAILHKKFSRGGLDSFDNESVKGLKNRPMIKIGG